MSEPSWTSALWSPESDSCSLSQPLTHYVGDFKRQLLSQALPIPNLQNYERSLNGCFKLLSFRVTCYAAWERQTYSSPIPPFPLAGTPKAVMVAIFSHVDEGMGNPQNRTLGS